MGIGAAAAGEVALAAGAEAGFSGAAGGILAETVAAEGAAGFVGASGATLAGATAASAAAPAAGAGLFSAGSLAKLSLGSSLLGGVTSAMGANRQGNANAAAAAFQAQVARNNAQIADQNRQLATAAGDAQTDAAQRKTRATVGGILSAQGGSGVDVNSGSAVDVRSSASELGQLSALNVRGRAAREAYGFGTQAASFSAEAGLDDAQAKYAKAAGDTNVLSSLLGGATSAGSQYALWKYAGVF